MVVSISSSISVVVAVDPLRSTTNTTATIIVTTTQAERTNKYFIFFLRGGTSANGVLLTDSSVNAMRALTTFCSCLSFLVVAVAVGLGGNLAEVLTVGASGFGPVTLSGAATVTLAGTTGTAAWIIGLVASIGAFLIVAVVAG